MKLGVLGLIESDLVDVNYNKIRWAAELDFHGLEPANYVGLAPFFVDQVIQNIIDDNQEEEFMV